MGSWYTLGVAAGLGTAVGLALTGAIRRLLPGLLVSAVVSFAVAYAVEDWQHGAAALLGAVCGSVGAAPLVAGALRRGGTPGATATLVGIAALLGAGFAFIPVVGYVEALAVLVLGLRLRRRAPDRHAGLRTLARD